MRLFALALLAAGLTAGTASAGPIVESLDGSDTFSANAYRGFAFTTPATGGPWNQITANFFTDGPGTTPTANGRLYLFETPYDGTPNGLSASSPFAVSNPAAGGVYSFDPSVTLLPDTTYFAYPDTVQSVTGDFGLGSYYRAGGADQNFDGFEGSLNYRVSGVAATAAEPIPEPATLAIFGGLALAGAVGYRRRKQHA